MSKFDKISNAIHDGKTLLGVGPMSWNCIDAVIEITNELDIPIKLIGSRRQIETEKLNGGYVTTTEKLANYVKQCDKKQNVFLARDHGGPKQGSNENDISFDKSWKNALISYESDILSEFDILHIDPSLLNLPFEEILKDAHLLYEYCEDITKTKNKNIIYESGTEEHGFQTANLKNFEFFVKTMKESCPKIKFVVGNTGLWVKELENVGKFDVEHVKKLIQICNDNDLYLKGHNSDYVDSKTLRQMNNIGIHSINIAPEYGVRETQCLLKLFDNHKMKKEKKEFIKIAVESNKWKKWMKNNRNVSNEYKAKICGHYISTSPEVEELKQKLRQRCDLDNLLKISVKNLILKHLYCLGWKQ